MKTVLTVIIVISIVSCPALYPLTVPSQGTDIPDQPVHSGGGEVSGAAITVRVFVLTIFIGLSAAGTIYLTDSKEDNDIKGWWYITPITAQGIFYLLLDEKGSPKEPLSEEPGISDPEIKE